MRIRYGMLMRPPGPGAVPKKGLLDMGFDEGYAPSGHHVWGWAEYDRKLSDEELSDYELEEMMAE